MAAAVKRSARWSEAVMRLYQKYPAAFKSSRWDEIVRLANAGDVKSAEFLAADHQDQKRAHRAQNVIARRVRIQRVALFKLQREHLARVKGAFQIAALALGNRMIHLPNNLSALAPMRQTTREVIIVLRRTLNVILTDLVWRSILLGVQNMGEAIKPILRDNAESFRAELSEMSLLESRLTIGMDAKFAKQAKGPVDLGSEKWTQITDRIYRRIVTSNMNGFNLSERIWDLTARAEQDIRRIVASDVAAGKSARDIADRINQYVYTSGIDEEHQTGPGIYRSPLKNALRVARTETNRAYTQASAAWAQNKPWIKGIVATLSPAHKVEDDCDDLAGETFSPDEFPSVIPAHPHCMCFGTYLIDENYLTGDTPSGNQEEGNNDE